MFAVVYPILIGLLIICIVTGRYERIINDFQLTRDTKEDLVTQIDICENMRKL